MVDWFGSKVAAKLAATEVEVARLRAKVEALTERLSSAKEEVADLRARQSALLDDLDRTHRQFVDLAGARALRSQSAPNPLLSLPALPGLQSGNGNGHHDGNGDSDDEDRMPRLTRTQKQQRQQDREMVRYGKMRQDAFESKWGADADPPTSD